ncbi:MAG: hypothetical protein DYG89_12515 [Caldilinea sp. CFX5]|nr:hypothetical protein [Caldilinea sp. CFX5]
MIILDENFPDSQRQILKGWRVPFKQVAFEIGREGIKDDEIIPLWHSLNRPTFFTLDEDFFRPRLRHGQYCLIYLDVAQYEAAAFVRRTLKHPDLNTTAKRMGKVINVSYAGLIIWELHATDSVRVNWQSDNGQTGDRRYTHRR